MVTDARGASGIFSGPDRCAKYGAIRGHFEASVTVVTVVTVARGAPDIFPGTGLPREIHMRTPSPSVTTVTTVTGKAHRRRLVTVVTVVIDFRGTLRIYGLVQRLRGPRHQKPRNLVRFSRRPWAAPVSAPTSISISRSAAKAIISRSIRLTHGREAREEPGSLGADMSALLPYGRVPVGSEPVCLQISQWRA